MINAVTLTFFAFLALFTAIGVYSVKRTKNTPEDSLLVVRALGGRLNAPVALTMQLGGIATALIWDKVLLYGGYAYAALPGMLFGFAVYGLAWIAVWRHEQETQEQSKVAAPEG